MTALVGASVLLIAASAIALVAGWVTADESLIWTSIGASVAAAVALALAFFRARQGDTGSIAVEAPAPEPVAAETERAPAATPAAEQHVRTRPPPRAKPKRQAEPPPAAKPQPTAQAPARKPAAGRGARRDAAVAGVPGRKKFHRTDCRYATAKTARSMTRGEAVGAGYEPCAICKP